MRLRQVALCDGGSRSRSRNGDGLGAGLNGSGHRGSGSRSCVDSRGTGLGVGRAVAGDVAGLGALVADLTGGAERATVRGGAIARDVAQLATGVALHGLGLAVTSEVVWAAALVAGGSARVAAKAAAEALVATAGTSTTASTRSSWVRAVAL